ncbi:hypothetical protein SAMN04488029_0068 [Reichenbachiella faecimaris]|uniref:Uncharacterized protein n=1 Tax=Reichenbachiella faecimaris TaxID=692418 RepID=A0A1W2G558_REIFA|nr:hypothetical protein [Reichenbachiella faecimaris]SMD31733.1 hypothetical protein SAMN04488029_0068 [Reichenbachiella faecimaris]
MKNRSSILVILLLISLPLLAQKKPRDIIFIVDELRTAWDIEALKMESYEGMKTYCHSKTYRKEILDLLRQIHHYDTTLYFTVTDKYDTNADPAAKETLDDIVTLETDYTNKKFVAFLKNECEKVIHIEKNLAKKDSGGFDKDIAALEDELILYIDAVTERVDLVDEHIHHLKELDPTALEVPKEKNEGTGF